MLDDDGPPRVNPNVGQIPGIRKPNSGAMSGFEIKDPVPPSTSPGIPLQTGLPAQEPYRNNAFSFRMSNGGGTPRVRERGVNANETVADHMQRLQRSDGRYMMNARNSGRREANSRGSMMGSYYAGASENAAINAALPIASQDAATYGRTAADNMDAANQAAIVGANNATQLTATGMTAGAGLEEARMRIEAQARESGLDRSFRSGESELDRGYGREGRQFDRDERLGGQTFQAGQNERDRAFRGSESALDRNLRRDESALDRDFDREQGDVAFRRQAFAYGLQTVLENPEYMRDPAGAAGLISYIQDTVNNIFRRVPGGG